jgi:hypothetical protein
MSIAMTKPFEEFWESVLSELDKNIFRTVRNWTADKGYGIGGDFKAAACRSLGTGYWEKQWGFPKDSPENGIACTRVQGSSWVFVTKQDFVDAYHKWSSYCNGTTRKGFAEGGNSTYLIALFKEFEQLMREQQSTRQPL